MLRVCATARLFIDFMLPNVKAGIFIDTDILLMDDIKVSVSGVEMLILDTAYCRDCGTISVCLVPAR